MIKRFEKEHTTQLIKIIETIMNQNYFQFNNKLYEQKEGIPVGSPVLGNMSEDILQIWRMHIFTTSQENTK